MNSEFENSLLRILQSMSERLSQIAENQVTLHQNLKTLQTDMETLSKNQKAVGNLVQGALMGPVESPDFSRMN